MGVSGSGKTTIATLLSRLLHCELADADTFHSAANVRKMASGIPLTDEDRWPWLDKISAWIQLHTASGTPGIITCSALRRVYRDRLSGPGVAFVHLDGSRDTIATRLSNRLDHFMPQSLLGSQFATLEPLEPDENGIVVELSRGPKDEVKEIMRRLHLAALPAPVYTDEGLLAD
jgi:gluconokinase